MNIIYDKILGRLRESGVSSGDAEAIASVLAELIESNEETSLNTNRLESMFSDLLVKQDIIIKYLKKIYNPE